MVDFLYSIDLSIFYFINHTLQNPLFDKFFPFITDVKHWHITFVLLWGISFFYGGRKGKVAAIGAIFVVIVADQFSSSLIKHLVQRIRPCNALPDVHLLAGCTSSFSFPSSHAVNNFAMATFFYKFFPKLKLPMFITAFLVAFSRPYCGVHYPSDVFFGGIIGAIIGYFMALLAIETDKFINKKYGL